MRNGSQPFISSESVRDVLDAMLYTSSPQSASPLEALSLVDHFIANPDLPVAVENREFALRHLFISIITHEYIEHRHNLGFESDVSQTTLEAAIEDIHRDVQQHNPELLGWCLLYYRYVRVDLNLSLESIMPITNIEQRTLRRYLTHAIERLRDCLIIREWEERTKQRKVRLYATLPASLPVSLVGREEMFQQVRVALSGQSLRHIQVTGPPGIGKSVFVQEFLRQQIDDGRIDQVVWIENPESVDFARRFLNEMLIHDLNVSLKEYTLTHKFAVVLDHLECTSAECAADLQQLLHELNAALVFVTSRIYIPLLQGVKYVSVKELAESDALTLVQNAIQLFEDEEFDREQAKLIYQAIGGNPYALTLAAHNFSIYRMDTTDKNVLDEIFNESYDSLDDETRHLWLTFALCPTGDVAVNLLSRLWSSLVNQERMMTLLQHYLIQPGQGIGHYVLPTSSRSFIQRRYAAMPATLEAIVETVDHHLSEALPFAFDVIEHILFSNWLDKKPTLMRKWINASLKEALRRGHCARWITIIGNFHKRYGTKDISLNVALGMCLRRVSQWPQAHRVLEEAIFDAGRAGEFYQQGRALFELGILYRQQGYYEKAATILEKADKIFSRYASEDAVNNLRIERAQVALERGDGEQAQIYLRDLPLTGRTLAMYSEIYRLLGDFVQSLDFAQQAIALNGDNPVAVGRLYASIGRIYDQHFEMDSAFDYFTRAIIILEREGDLWALARAQSNMGALLVRLENSYEAYEILSKAENIQVMMGDRVGLESTRHNFRILRGRFGG